jgi:hypothetical protein
MTPAEGDIIGEFREMPDRAYRNGATVVCVLDSVKFAVIQADPAELSPPAAAGACRS